MKQQQTYEIHSENVESAVSDTSFILPDEAATRCLNLFKKIVRSQNLFLEILDHCDVFTIASLSTSRKFIYDAIKNIGMNLKEQVKIDKETKPVARSEEVKEKTAFKPEQSKQSIQLKTRLARAKRFKKIARVLGERVELLEALYNTRLEYFEEQKSRFLSIDIRYIEFEKIKEATLKEKNNFFKGLLQDDLRRRREDLDNIYAKLKEFISEIEEFLSENSIYRKILNLLESIRGCSLNCVSYNL